MNPNPVIPLLKYEPTKHLKINFKSTMLQCKIPFFIVNLSNLKKEITKRRSHFELFYYREHRWLLTRNAV